MNLQELKTIYTDIFYLKETMILDVIVATAIATKLPGDPLWILIIGSPSSGKSELVNILNKVPFVFPVSSMTENTFLSNMRLGNGKEASLLHEIGTAGMITMKDYTSILAMRPEKREIIVSQMREIYDGHLTKKAGNGNSEEWHGKINWIGAVTESVYLTESESAGMGRRTCSYVMPDQDRLFTLRRALQNNSDIAEKRERIQNAFAEYIMEHVDNLPSELPELTDEFTEELIVLSNFITHVRTPTSRDYRGQLILVPSLEMPMRVFQMFQTLARVLVYLHEGANTDDIRAVMRKIAFDSIPKQTSLVLNLLATYSKITAKGAATKLRYPTETVRTWLENVNVLGLCEREDTTGVGADVWVLKEEYQEIMVTHGGSVKRTEALLDGSERMSGDEIQPAWMAQAMVGTDDPGAIKEFEEKQNSIFDSF